MSKRIDITEDYLYLPVQVRKEEKRLEIYCLEEDGSQVQVMEFMVPVGEETGTCDYFACLPVKQFTGKALLLKGEVTEDFMKEVTNGPFYPVEPLRRPSIHFTGERGWINDPNGLVYDKGCYHLYYQYNPCNTEWNNMCWGHAVSRELLFWEHQDLVLTPDSDGMIFSGSAVRNDRALLGLPEDAILYFYTAAGGQTQWNRGKLFTQKVAYSLDGGYTLKKTELGKLDTIKKENRDPKVFWHEESGAYIMSLWLEGSEFALLRSENLLNWEITDRLVFDGAWECPDLFQVKDEEGSAAWIFWSADGYYYLGEFDGYHFRTDGIRHCAYINKMPYAAQTFSGITDRVISITWLRTSARTELYTGAMGIPRELTLARNQGEPVLALHPIRELEAYKKEIPGNLPLCLWEKGKAVMVEMLLALDGQAVTEWQIAKTTVCYNRDSGNLTVNGEEYAVGQGIRDFVFLLDDVIFEVAADHDKILGIFELTEPAASITAKPEQFEEYRIYQIERQEPAL